jgi:hypothetical protein
MYDARKIIPGLALFVGLITFPIWSGQGRTGAPPDLKLDTPAIQRLADKRCIEPKEAMTADHMQLLDSWRDEVVRNGRREYKAAGGKAYEMSLSHTCLNCHSNKEQFCDRCHDSQGVKPNCWSCHVVPKEKG